MTHSYRGPLLFSVAALLLASAVQAADPPVGFESLFNGNNLSGWHGMGHVDPRKLADMSESERTAFLAEQTADALQHWTVENGELVNDGQGAYLTTDREYGDIELILEYRTVPLADSGIYLRGSPQVQIWDPTEEAKFSIGANKGSGGLWNNNPGTPGKDPLVRADRPFGEWNHFRIVQIGSRISVWLNHQQVVDHAIMHNFWDRSRPMFARGPIQLQTHGGEIRWRNLFVREIPPSEANRLLAAENAWSFRRVFNGKDLTGWAGPTAGYEVVNGELRTRPGSGGTIYLQEELTDFAARLEFQLPPGGNSGLAIRYPGSGDAAYSGMCELQILDNDAEKYASLDPRQFHGSAYGMVAAERGYLRPTGEWNFQEVTIKGPTIRVELNGNVILDADLSTVTELMANSPHPGKDRTSGFFGIAGHSDPVKFRNIAVRELP